MTISTAILIEYLQGLFGSGGCPRAKARISHHVAAKIPNFVLVVHDQNGYRSSGDRLRPQLLVRSPSPFPFLDSVFPIQSNARTNWEHFDSLCRKPLLLDARIEAGV